jgi:streptogramin lyase
MKDYLAANLGSLEAPDPNSRFPHHLMEGEARNYRVVQYELGATHVETHDVAVDPQGVGWANQRTGGMISRFDPETYEYTEIGPPLLLDAKRARPGNLQISPDGIMWLADPFSKRWLSYDIANNEWTDWMFPMEPERGQVEGVNPVVHHNGAITDFIRGQVQGNSLVINPHDDMIYMSGPGSIRRLDPTTGEWSTWDSPTWLAIRRNPGGYGITVDGGNHIWEAENLVDKLARYTPATGEVQVFDLEPGAYPRRMDYNNDGDVFVGLWGTSKILKIDHETTEMSEILPPIKENGAYSIDFDKSTNLLWVTFQTADYIARYNLETEEWLMLPMPQAESDIRRIEVDQNRPNRVWWVTNAFDARIGYLELQE